MPNLTLFINGQPRRVDVAPDVPLLWVLRDEVGLTGTKFGCGRGFCGACTVHLDGVAVRSCVTPVASVGQRRITTIEGLAAGDDALHPVQIAWIDEDVPQCGYCQAGQMMAAAAFLSKNSRPSDDDILGAMSANLCRCGTYHRIRRAVRRAADLMAERRR
jgi:isoquinoline 1-oxidoreductase subunit alpha